jgi:hypothetical protein
VVADIEIGVAIISVVETVAKERREELKVF